MTNEGDDALRRRRVLPMDAFAAELREGKLTKEQRLAKFGVAVVPIPVPLLPDETEHQYERRFVEWVALTYPDKRLEEMHSEPHRERSMRFAFAHLQAQAFTQHDSISAAREKGDESHPQKKRRDDEEDLTREIDLTLEDDSSDEQLAEPREPVETFITTLEEYRQRQSMKQLAEELKSNPFSPPVFVPLAPGETVEQYESRFLEWLRAEFDMTLEQVQNHAVHDHERLVRIRFADLNRSGVQKFDPTRRYSKRKRSLPQQDLSSSLEVKSKRPRRSDSSSGQSELMNVSSSNLAHSKACRCHKCLAPDAHAASSVAVVVDRPSTSTVEISSSPDFGDLTENGSFNVVMAEDPVESTPSLLEDKFMADYDEINEQILLHETALEASVANFRSQPIRDLADTKRAQLENAKRLEQINEERVQRKRILAQLLVVMWQDDPSALSQLVESEPTEDSAFVQRWGHHKCHELAVAVIKQRAIVGDLVMSSSPSRHLSPQSRATEELDRANSEIQRLRSAQRRAFEAIARADTELQQLVRRHLQQQQV